MTSSNKPLKAFVSSTFLDLKDHRAHVINSLRNAGFFVDPMENWSADSDEPKKFSQDRLAGCQLCVLLVAFRRGFVPDGEARSITQMEYEAALKQGVEVLVYQLDENAKWWAKYDEREKDLALKVWRSSLGKKHGMKCFSDDPTSVDVTSALTRWLAKKNPVRLDVKQIEQINWPKDKSPYPGLVWFDEEYAPVFFGRDRDVNELVAKMCQPEGRVLLVSGASGSGKSSVIAAGVWHAVIKDGGLPGSIQWKWHRIQPSDGETPLDALSRKLKDVWKLSARPDLTATATLRDLLSKHITHDQELIVFVDQFEELFTSSFNEPDIQAFLEQVISTAQVPANRLRIVATIRSEFLEKLYAYESTLNLLNSPYCHHLRPVSSRMLEEMVRKPAEATHCEFESGLIERIVDDIGQEPGHLPLVAYCLGQLFDKRKDRMLTVEAYEAMGGVVGAIATKANDVLGALPDEVRGTFNRVFAELVHLNRERLPTRRRTAVSTFSPHQAVMQLIDALAGQECRVMVTSGTGQEAVVEVAHEKLFTAWPKLREWIDESGEALRDIDHAEEEALRWQKGGDNPHELWFGSRANRVLAAIEGFGKHPSPELQRFLQPQEVLIAQLNQAELSHQDRLLIGQKLAEFGDPRPGVGLNEKGLPDIAWIDIPGGPIELMDDEGGGVVGAFEVNPFRIAKYSVTNVQFKAFLKAEDGYRNAEWWRDLEQSRDVALSLWQEANAPRETVSWDEAVAFCRWLSVKTDVKTIIRLPTEWEWQQAASGGDLAREYPWGGGWDEFRCNSRKSQLNRTIAVGMYPHGATEHGVLDMAGNVWEWCLNKPDTSIFLVGRGLRVVRGGSHVNSEGRVRLWSREVVHDVARRQILGFRLVQDIESNPLMFEL